MPSALSYRPDIDGCRAIAILLVMGYHLGLPWLSGGFVGVDVFFVISGYLITSLLLAEQRDTGRIDFAAFYARRARRLLPALVTMIAVVLVIGAVLLLPDQQRQLALSALAALLFSANFQLLHVHQGYFAEQSYLVPLLHLWTLSVEEQFYLLWPVALAILAAVARRRGWRSRRLMLLAITAGTLASFAIGVAWAGNLGFLLLPGRAWQLGVGALLAFVPALPPRGATAVRLAGLAAIAVAGALISDNLPYTSYHALLPVAGAACLVVPSQQAGPVERWLGARSAVGLGKLSYGWYLWHWPLLALAHQVWEVDLARDAVIALAALLVAALSYQWIERPFREGRFCSATPRKALATGAAALGACGLLAAGIWEVAGVPAAPGSITAQYLAARGGAARGFAFCGAPEVEERCVRGASMSGPGILLWGDSHAAHLALGLERAARPAGAHVVIRTMGACNAGGRDGEAQAGPSASACATFNASVLSGVAALKRTSALRTVLLAGDWGMDGRDWEARLARVAASLRAAGLDIVLAQDLPLQPPNYLTCAARRSPRDCAVSREAVDTQLAANDAVLRRIAAANPGVTVWTPRDALCPERRCVTVMGGRLLFRNRSHLTLDGSAVLAPTLVPIIPRR
ncbi:acyltransferase family protein [Sphingomonas sp.]|uniref:acyltransferase family protein n=1 Tax=Sphingomonas sp. TaxID=28214 RepID=UPI0025DE699F|nr:acyltransferase family protein [Sphingomonas sp.]